MFRSVEKFVQGHVIHVKYWNIKYSGKQPITFAAVPMYLTVAEHGDDGEVIIAKRETDSEIDIDDNAGSPIITLKINTVNFDPEKLYAMEFWIDDATAGKQDIDNGIISVRGKKTTFV